MTVNELAQAEGFSAVSLTDGERTICGAYAGDLLSWVMGKASADNAFVTIMNNVNVIAVAKLVDLSCVILCDNAEINDEFKATAHLRGINILLSSNPVYETCVALSRLI